MAELTTKDEMMAAFAPMDDELQPPPKSQPLVPKGQQIETRPIGAQVLPIRRDEARIMNTLSKLAAAAGDDWYYSFPVKKKVKGDDGKVRWVQDAVEGPTIKCANTVARLYGNCEVDVRTVDMGDAWVFYARFLDFESGYALTRAFQQRRGQQSMNTDAGRAADIVFQIGQSKAIRNVICNVLSLFTDFAFQEAKQAIVDKVGKNLPHYKSKTIARLGELRIDVKRVETVLARPVDKWLAPDVARVIAEIQAIQDGMAHADDLYPQLGVPEKKPDRATVANEHDEDGVETALARAARLLGKCTTKNDVEGLAASIAEELKDDAERERLKGLCEARLEEITNV